YGAGTPAMIELDHNALFFALKKEAFHSSILEMDIGGKVEKVLLRDFQMHAYKPLVQHIDFQRVDETTRLRKKVPLHFINEENSVAVKTDKCLVSHVRTDLEIQCLASQLPEFVTIDLGHLEKNQSIHASDLKLPAGIKAVKHGTQNPVIVAVTMPKVEEEIVPVVVVAAEKGKGKPKKTEKQNQK
ncbi:MAG: 50S ribosomal protein L25/general stress protein Ctc, partial [Rubrivivax sp.]|nr:50S ribosomal protein L25/general stress protein Ctc [Rubrivivax sp.]